MRFVGWIKSLFSGQGREDASAPQLYLLLQRAHAHLQLEEYDEARALLLQVTASRDSITDSNAIAYTLDALDVTWILTERYDDAIAFFSGYISRYPKEAEAYSGRADSFWYSGRFQDAIDDYSRALELKPNHILSLSGRGQVLSEAGEHAKAIEDLDSALKALKAASAADASRTKWCEQIEAFVHNGRGFALAAFGDLTKAEKEFELSIELSPGNAWVYHNRGQAFDRNGDWERATADYRMALTKKEPALSPLRKKHAEERLSELSTRS
jgi:tetratricopeptide (TPR) repeat protein